MSVKKVTRDQLVKVFHGIGCITADTWDNKKLLEKANEQGKLSALRDGQPIHGLVGELYFDITSHVEGGGTLELEGDFSTDTRNQPAKTPKKKQPAKVKKEKVTAKVKATPKKAAPPKARDPLDPDTRGPGVIWTIVEILRSASKSKPLTKKEVLDKLCKEFPDRGRSSLDNTVSSQIPHRIHREKGIKVSGSGEGYWIEGKVTKK